MNSIGVLGERIAWRYLRQRGFTILERNYYIRGGEIDLIALHNRTLVFIEIKTRTQKKFGMGVESIGHSKRRSLRRTMSAYLASGRMYKHVPGAQFIFSYDTVRFDVIDIQLNLTKNEIEKFTHFKNGVL